MKENEKIWVVKDGYIVLRNGTIFRLNWKRTGKCVEVKQSVNNCGYLQFSCNGTTTVTHRFIAECFLPNPNNFSEINHKNENKTDNRVENLEWCDRKYNNNYGTRNKRVGEKMKKYWGSEENRKKRVCKSQKNNPKKCKKVYQYTKDGVLIKEWGCGLDIQKQLGYKLSNISRCCSGKLKYAYGFMWTHKRL